MANIGEDMAFAVRDAGAPEIFASDVSGFLCLNQSIIAVTFATSKTDYSMEIPESRNIEVCRLILPIDTAQKLSLQLHDTLVRLGHDPSAAARGEATPQ